MVKKMCLRLHSTDELSPQQITVQPDYLSMMPDLCLLEIFRNLSLSDLFRLGDTCRRFKDLHLIECRRRRSLSIVSYCEFDYKNANARVKMDLLRFFDIDTNLNWFNLIIKLQQGDLYDETHPVSRRTKCRSAVDRLCASFSGIEELTLFDCPLNADEFVQILGKWQHSLVTLRIAIMPADFNLTKIVPSLNRLSKLQHLSLYSAGGIIWHVHANTMPVLRQLKTFQYAYYDYYFSLRKATLYQLLAQLNPDRLQHLGLGIFAAHTHSGPFVRYNLKKLREKKPAIASRLTRLKFPRLTATFMSFLCTNYPNITWLDMEFHGIDDLFTLSRVKLTHLTLRSNQLPYSHWPLGQFVLLGLPRMFHTVKRLLVLDFAIETGQLQYAFPNAQVQRADRGDDNEVDYPGLEDIINVNKFNWRQIGHSVDRFREKFNEQLEQQRRLIALD